MLLTTSIGFYYSIIWKLEYVECFSLLSSLSGLKYCIFCIQLCLELLKNYNIFKKPIKVKEIQHIVNNLGLKRTKGYESTAVKTFVHKRGLNIKYKKKDIGV